MKRVLPLVVAAGLLTGCDDVYVLLGWWPPPETITETGSAELKKFESEAEFSSYLKSQITERNALFSRSSAGFDDFDNVALSEDGGATTGGAGEADAAPAAPSQDGSVGDTAQTTDEATFSQTTTQEAGVDEADVVKTDGSNIYVINEQTLHILEAYPVERLAKLSQVELEGYGREMYLYDGKVVALTETYGEYVYRGLVTVEPELIDVPIESVPAEEGTDVGNEGSTDAEPAETRPDDTVSGDDAVDSDPLYVTDYQYERPKTIVTIIDVSLPDRPSVISTTKFEGSMASSRMIDGMMHLVLSNYQDYYYDVLPLLGSPDLDIAGVDSQALLPSFEQTASDGSVREGPAVTWEELYRPTDPDGFGTVTVISFDIDDGYAFKSVGIVAEPGLVYSSRDALYLTDTNYDFLGNTRTTTDIYKLAYDETGAVPVAVGSVPGRLLNQYSMSEHGGYLRVASTIDATFSAFDQLSGPSNGVYVLEETDGSLVAVGSVTGIAPGETIQSVRFVGDRGYVVTFVRIDPLFTLDLSDPTDPRIVGELKVPGFSTYLVPMDEDHLLAVGQYIPEETIWGNWGVQLSIFDVSDFSAPLLMHTTVLGEAGGASSEALWNPKAFTYFPEAGTVALPVSIYDSQVFFGDDILLVDIEEPPAIDPGGIDVVSEPVGQTTPDEPIEPIDSGVPYVSDSFDGLVVFDVSVENGFSERGRISTRFDESGYYWSSFTRGVFVEEMIYAVTAYGLRTVPVNDMRATPKELVYGQPREAFTDEPSIDPDIETIVDIVTGDATAGR